jgi:cell division protease FtsH
MAEALLEYETIDREQIDEIMAGGKPRPPKNWQDPGPGDLDASDAADPDPRPSGPVGGPASEH